MVKEDEEVKCWKDDQNHYFRGRKSVVQAWLSAYGGDMRGDIWLTLIDIREITTEQVEELKSAQRVELTARQNVAELKK